MKSPQKKTHVKKQKQPKAQTADDIITIYSGDTSSYTIGPIDMSTLSTTITSPIYTSGTSSIGNITINSAGSNYSYSAPTWTASNTYNASNTVQINNNGMVLNESADIKIGDKSLKEFMLKMEERLAILVPDPKKLEQFEALKKAYEHYKLMEKLCQDKPIEEP